MSRARAIIINVLMEGIECAIGIKLNRRCLIVNVQDSINKSYRQAHSLC